MLDTRRRRAKVGFGVLAAIGVLALGGCDPTVLDLSVKCGSVACLESARPSASDLDTSVYLDWPLVDGADTYNIYYSTTPGVTVGSGTPLLGQAPPHVISGLSNLTTYYAIVANEKNGQIGPASAEVTVTPQATGSADISFGGGTGTVTQTGVAGGTLGPGGTANDRGDTAVMDAQGRLVVAGQSDDAAGNTYLAVWRRNVDGTPDLTFGGTGVLVAPAATGTPRDYAVDIAIDSKGRIVIAGVADPNNFSAIWRITPSGQLDSTFNGPGYVATKEPTAAFEAANGVAVDAQNRVLALGFTNHGSGPAIIIYRFLENGVPDGSWTDGACQVLSTVGGCIEFSGVGPYAWDLGVRILVESDQSITVVGRSSDEINNSRAVVWRFNPDGTPDTTFNASGPGLSVIGTAAIAGRTIDGPTSAVHDAAGRVVMAGISSGAALPTYMVVWRLDAVTGALDTTWSNGCQFAGCSATNGAMGGILDEGRAIAIDSTGRVVVAGLSDDGGGNYSVVVWRYNPDSTIDTTFGGGSGFVAGAAPAGLLQFDGPAAPVGLFLDPAGRIVVTGFGQEGMA